MVELHKCNVAIWELLNSDYGLGSYAFFPTECRFTPTTATAAAPTAI